MKNKEYNEIVILTIAYKFKTYLKYLKLKSMQLF